MLQSPGYLARLLPPLKDYQSEEYETRLHVENGTATEDERAVVIAELVKANWPPHLAETMTRSIHPITHEHPR